MAYVNYLIYIEEIRYTTYDSFKKFKQSETNNSVAHLLTLVKFPKIEAPCTRFLQAALSLFISEQWITLRVALDRSRNSPLTFPSHSPAK